MNINFKIKNKSYIFILIAIILLSLLFSCYNKDVIIEGLNSECAHETTPNAPPYGDNSGIWYDISCGSTTNNSFAIIPSIGDITTLKEIPCKDISDVSFNNYFTTAGNTWSGYTIDYSNNNIVLFKLKENPDSYITIIFNCSGLANNAGISFDNHVIYPKFYTGNITKRTSNSDKINVFKYPDDFLSDDTPASGAGAAAAAAAAAAARAAAAREAAKAASGKDTINIYTTGAKKSTDTSDSDDDDDDDKSVYKIPAIAFPSSINSVLTPTHQTFLQSVAKGFDTLFGSGGSNSSLYMNNISDINGDSSTPSTIFTTLDGRQGVANTNNTINGIPSSQIPQGQEDLYILKSQVVPPVCPACPPVIVDKDTINQDCPPCPPCARCPEPSFDCKKVPNYNLGPENSFLPRPVLNDFSTFGM